MPTIGSMWQRLKHTPRKLPTTLKQDGIAGLTGAIGSVPDGMAAGILAGVNPIYGLYGSIAGPIVGGALASSRLMLVTTTSAAALAAGGALSGLSGSEKAKALFLLTALVGALQIGAGLLRLGRFVRFVSHSVMVGFLSGIAMLIILGQIPTVTGFGDAEGRNKIAQTVDVLTHLGRVDTRSLLIGVATVILAIALPKTRLGTFGMLLALLIPSVTVLLLGWDSVGLVEDVSEIPSTLPLPGLPSLSFLSLDLISGAIAIAVIVLVQGAGVGQSVPNPDGESSDASRDFVAQGGANVASGLFQGMPVGGSVSQTALNVTAGAQSRWAAISSGIWMIILVGSLSLLVAKVAMPTLAGLLILAGYRTINPVEAFSIWNTGWSSRIAILTTFVGTLLLPIQLAVGLGVALSILFYLNSSAEDVRVVELVELPDHRVEERDPPEVLPSHTVTVLDIYGSLFFAGAWTIQGLLPSTRGAERPVVVLRLRRGRASAGATFVQILSDYATRLSEVGGRLYLSGVEDQAVAQLRRTGKLDDSEAVRVFPQTTIIGDSTRQAMIDARAWLAQYPATSVPIDGADMTAK